MACEFYSPNSLQLPTVHVTQGWLDLRLIELIHHTDDYIVGNLCQRPLQVLSLGSFDCPRFSR